ncbi:unnamed protein product [Lymnaea stagnalis]|uniref:G-protein coupled receptors family 1 profile domain-containing protein n=1 Tax=Lymnaea stagnalis TaxID=6523 RepID=A0AAV2IBJ2_LYMST
MRCDDSASVTLISLTLSDLLGLVVLFWMGMCYNPWIIYSDVPFDTLSVVYLSGGWPKIYVSRVTSWITAFVAAERCLCIALPLRVKTILTRRRSAYVNAALFLLIFLMMPPIYYTTGLDWQWFPDRNKTLLGLSFTPERDGVYDAVASANIVLAYVSFVVIVACTLVLVYVLKKQTLWRSTASAAEKSSPLSMRELRASKMVLLLTVMFLVCYLPGTALLLVMIFVPEFNKGMFYNNLFTVVWAFVHLTEALNSSVNIFVYRGMSSRFKTVLNRMFHCAKGDPHLEIHSQNQDKSKF